ncbi:ATPase [Xylanibacillus composti]|uniref:N-acetylglucosamine kinase n=1 Tax=Xylanibacillus composti TaxID=1572762 RepID=A0A8J4M2R1_9BACL|nr:BadF/BadG/BcrA/BcrD ATPase family protein [Xylanibacillus composti]MDT9726059.1 ATPase [Xylanibacillus composti]GIQ68796.1 N-acetylglucosamine kinase [Xylanibacillus composti]
MSFIMGVDGGGSKTFTVITDAAGNLAGEGFALGANHQTIGIDNAKTHIVESMNEALKSAGLKLSDLSYIQYALAGADRESDYRILRPALAQIPAARWGLECDTMAGLRSGSPDNAGVVLVCGSGTNAVGRSRSGKVVQTGGFGYLYGDNAGGSRMAVETFRAAVRSWDQRDIPSVLVEKVPAYFGFENMEALYNDFLDRQKGNVPVDLTIVLHEAVKDGDQLAIRILAKVGEELGLSANSVLKRIGDFGIDKVPIVLIGSVFQKGRSSHLLQALKQTVLEENANVEFVIPEMEPVFGAVLLGMDHLKISVRPDIIEKFNSYRKGERMHR